MIVTRKVTAILENFILIFKDLAYEENSMGRFLKDYGKMDKTKAGKMMVAVGKSMSYSGQQRLAIRSPLVRLYQEVETFHDRAIEDTFKTVKKMEKIRTEYRGALVSISATTFYDKKARPFSTLQSIANNFTS